MGRRKHKPTDPQDMATIAERRAERRELEARGITVNVDSRTEEITARYRADCFTMLLKGRPEEQAALQWLDELLRTASGEKGAERRPDFIRGSAEGAPGQNVSQAMIDADAYLVVVTEALPPQCARMLFELLKPDAALEGQWRPVVKRCTGEINPVAQGVAVRMACGQLRWVQLNIERLMRERRDRRLTAD